MYFAVVCCKVGMNYVVGRVHEDGVRMFCCFLNDGSCIDSLICIIVNWSLSKMHK